MTKKELLADLKEIAAGSGAPESKRIAADLALLAYIDDDEVRAAYEKALKDNRTWTA